VATPCQVRKQQRLDGAEENRAPLTPIDFGEMWHLAANKLLGVVNFLFWYGWLSNSTRVLQLSIQGLTLRVVAAFTRLAVFYTSVFCHDEIAENERWRTLFIALQKQAQRGLMPGFEFI